MTTSRFFWGFFSVLGLLASAAQASQKGEGSLTPTRVSCPSFVRQALRSGGNIHDLVRRLEQMHGGENFVVPLPVSKKRLFFFQDSASVKGVLKANTDLTYVNQNFDISHGHFHTINAVNTDTQLWKDLHSHLGQIFKTKKITSIMLKHRDVLMGKRKYVLNDALEEFFLKVWGEYCFGPIENLDEFKDLRLQLVNTLASSFHRNPLNRLPFIGRWTSRQNYKSHKKSFDEVDAGLQRLLESAIQHKQGAFYELYERLAPNYPNAFQIALDNSFLGILVYDFIYGVLLDAMVNIAQNPEMDRAEQVERSVHQGFLYPFRFRIAKEDIIEQGIRKGDYIAINLQKSGTYFSYGARFCPGMNLFYEVSRTLLDFYKRYDLRATPGDSKIIYSENQDIPIMMSRHEVAISPLFKGKNLIVAGAALSGKGTFSEQLSIEYGLPVISSGAIVQDEIDRKTPFGLKVAEMKAKGELLPDTAEYMGLVLQKIKVRLAACKKGFVLDGIPRTEWQAQELLKIFAELGIELDAFVEIHASRTILRERAFGRLVCNPCKASYNVTTRPPREAGHCDQCGGPLKERLEDTNDQVLEGRWNDYDSTRDAILKAFDGKVVAIDGEGDPQTVFQAGVQAIADHQNAPKFPRDFLERRIAKSPHPTIEGLQIYNLVEMYKVPGLLQYVVDTISESALEKKPDYVAGIDARGLPVFGAVSYATGIPGIMIRKAGKLPRGAKLIKETYKTAYSEDSIEMVDDPALHGKTVVLIDDGLASAGTMVAAANLLEKAGMKVVLIFGVVEHHYVQRVPEYAKWEDITRTLFDLSVEVPSGADEIFETERKFLLPKLSALSPRVLTALRQGRSDPLVSKRGYVLQQYLPVEHVPEMIQELKKSGIEFGDEKTQQLFLSGQVQAQELRLMSKSILVRERSGRQTKEEILQVTVKGAGGVSAVQLETRERLGFKRAAAMHAIFNIWSPRAKSSVRKAYFETILTEPDGTTPILQSDGKPYAVEVDFYLAGTRDKPELLFANGEVEFHGPTQDDSVVEANNFWTGATVPPVYFGTELTEEKNVKARNIAQTGVPDPWRTKLSEHQQDNQRILLDILEQYDTWAHWPIWNGIWKTP